MSKMGAAVIRLSLLVWLPFLSGYGAIGLSQIDTCRLDLVNEVEDRDSEDREWIAQIERELTSVREYSDWLHTEKSEAFFDLIAARANEHIQREERAVKHGPSILETADEARTRFEDWTRSVLDDLSIELPPRSIEHLLASEIKVPRARIISQSPFPSSEKVHEAISELPRSTKREILTHLGGGAQKLSTIFLSYAHYARRRLNTYPCSIQFARDHITNSINRVPLSKEIRRVFKSVTYLALGAEYTKKIDPREIQRRFQRDAKELEKTYERTLKNLRESSQKTAIENSPPQPQYRSDFRLLTRAERLQYYRKSPRIHDSSEERQSQNRTTQERPTNLSLFVSEPPQSTEPPMSRAERLGAILDAHLAFPADKAAFLRWLGERGDEAVGIMDALFELDGEKLMPPLIQKGLVSKFRPRPKFYELRPFHGKSNSRVLFGISKKYGYVISGWFSDEDHGRTLRDAMITAFQYWKKSNRF